MTDPTSQENLLHAVSKFNAGNQETAVALHDRLGSAEGVRLRNLIEEFNNEFGLLLPGTSAKNSLGLDLENEAAQAVVELLRWHADLAGRGQENTPRIVFRFEQSDAFPAKQEPAALLVNGATALGYINASNEALIESLMHITAGADIISTLFKQALRGRPDQPLTSPIDPSVPPDFPWPLTVPGGACWSEITHALIEFSQLVRWSRAQGQVKYQVWAAGIERLTPSMGHAGDQILISGTGFAAAQPPGVMVLFPGAGGGCTAAHVSSWTQSEIVAIVPEGTGHGYVGFVERSPPEGPDIPVNLGAAIELGSILEGCFGAAAAAVAGRITHWLPLLPSYDCPKPLENDANYFEGGPEILSLHPIEGCVGDEITAKGYGFSPVDAVIVGDVLVPQSVHASSAEVKFIVPNVYGGPNYVKVRRPPGHLSNPVSVTVLPVISGANATRVRSGAYVTLDGTGFSRYARVRLHDVETIPSSVTLHETSFRIFRPTSLPGGDKMGLGMEVRVVNADGRMSNAIQLTLDPYRIVVFGDSIIWGQGLETPSKFTSLVRNYLSLAEDSGVYVDDVFAHSGAIVGRKPSPDNTNLPRIDSEVPTSYPTIYQQIDEWKARGAGYADRSSSIRLVLVNGGINDCNIRFILSPLSSPIEIRKAVALHCHDGMKEILEYVALTFPNARIIVTGYYSIISEESKIEALAAFLIAMGVALAAIPGAIVMGIVSVAARRAVILNSQTYAIEANKQLGLAVDEVNASLGSSPCIFLAIPSYGPSNAALAPDSWLWEINVEPFSITAKDPLAARRATECSNVGATRGDVDVATCRVASVGHPNPRGAEAFFRAIEPFIP